MYENQLADATRSFFGGQDHDFIDLDGIAAKLGIEVRGLDDALEDGASGWFRLIDGRPVILINRERPGTHQRLMFAHELGHCIMGHGERARDTRQQLQKRDPVEFAANRFATALLMPKGRVENAIMARRTIPDMANSFGVSEEALGYRLQNLGYSVVVR